MLDKNLKIFAVVIAIGFVIVIDLAFAGIQGKALDDWVGRFSKEVNHLEYKIDSLEKIVNTDFKIRRDTIIVDIKPQIIKIYNQNGSNSTNSTNSSSISR